MRFAVMVEGQEDVTWEQWRALAATTERLGFDALLRSDHYGSVDGDTARGEQEGCGGCQCALGVPTPLHVVKIGRKGARLYVRTAWVWVTRATRLARLSKTSVSTTINRRPAWSGRATAST